ncbi:MAG: transglycosylase domain-containing protein, partial [Methylocystis sp.]
EYMGPVTLTRALSLSLNTVAIRVGLEAGPKTVAKTAHRLGIKSELQINPSIALGTSEVTPLELVTAYAPFANGGIGVTPHVITKVTTASGKFLYQDKTEALGRVIDPPYVAMMNRMMQETLLTGTARKAELPGWQAAGKTGTSQDFRDAWFIGYTSHLVTGVWLGNDDNSPTKKASGGNLPVEIWSHYMTVAHQGVEVVDLPSGRWSGESVALEEVAKPLDDLIGIFTGTTRHFSVPQAASESTQIKRQHDAAQDSAGASASSASKTADKGNADQASSVQPGTLRQKQMRETEELTPPEDIPNISPPPATVGSGGRPAHNAPQREKNFIENLFGG